MSSKKHRDAIALKRAPNKAARQARRFDIENRWVERHSARVIENITPAACVDYYEQAWREDMFSHYDVAAMILEEDLRPEQISQLAAYLLRVIVLKEMPYADYLKTPEWKRQAARAKKRYGGKCALDAKHGAADAHHRTYERRGRERPEDVVPLCRDCHQRHHVR